MASYDIYLKRIKDGKYKLRNEYREKLITLQRGIRGSYLKYLNSDVFSDLVLYDKKGNELGRVCSSNPVGYICNHFLKLK